MNSPIYKRILLKLSGEALLGSQSYGIDPERVADICRQVVEVKQLGVQVGIVIGGGNIFRGLSGVGQGIDRVTGDHMGMLATVMNGLALQTSLEKQGCDTRVLTAIKIDKLAEMYIKRRAVRHLEKGRIVIFVGGTGNPFFTTDTAASLRASEIEADILIKGTRVDGVYSADPEKDPQATFYPHLTFTEALKSDLRIMDATAFALARENKLPIRIFNLLVSGNLMRVVTGEEVGTLVSAVSHQAASK